MPQNPEFQDAKLKGLQSILIIGCGLIGTSMAMGLKQVRPDLRIDGVESYEQHQQTAEAAGVFTTIYRNLPSTAYDLAVIATPVDAARRIMHHISSRAVTIMDVCSVKQSVCEAADGNGLRDRFAPTHPMAGASESGPQRAAANLFEGRTWLCLEEWPMCAAITPVIEALGARVEYVNSAAAHDAAMAAVSHGMHVTSLAAMLTYQQLQEDAHGEWAALTGPGFRDLTRLSAAGSGFWTSTLMENRDHVMDYISALQGQLNLFRQALAADNPGALTELLQSSRLAYKRWRGQTNE